MKQSIVAALFLLLQGIGVGHVSANPYPSTYEAPAHSPYVLVSKPLTREREKVGSLDGYGLRIIVLPRSTR